MPNEFQYDVFLRHSSKDKAVVRSLAERLRRHRRRASSQLSTPNHQPTGAPLNKECRFILLRLDVARIRGSLAQFLYVNWPSGNRKQEGLKARKEIAQAK